MDRPILRGVGLGGPNEEAALPARRSAAGRAGSGGGLAAHQPEAVAAVDRARPGWPEGHLRVLAAAGADGIEHLAWPAAVAAPTGTVAATIAVAAASAATSGRAPLGAARGTALGRRGESLLREELLLGRREDEV